MSNRNNSIISIAIFHASSVGLSYSLVCTCFSFFISIELFTKRNRYICVCICLMFDMIDIRSLLMPISRPGLFLDYPPLFVRFLQPISKYFFSRSIGLLKTNKAVGLDNISARLFKDSVDVITPSLTNLYYLHECELQWNAWNVNFSTVLCTVFILNTHPVNKLWKAGAALVNTISSFK